MWSESLVNIGFTNSLLPDDTRPLPEQMVTNQQWGLVAFRKMQQIAILGMSANIITAATSSC